MDHFCLCRIRDLYRAILNFEQYFEQHYDLNLNEAMLLCTLSARSSQTAGEVAEALLPRRSSSSNGRCARTTSGECAFRSLRSVRSGWHACRLTI